MQVIQRTALRAPLVAGLLASVVLVATPAQAATRTFSDVAGDTDAPSDVTRVVVHNATNSNRVTVTARMGNVISGDSATLWLDTRPRNPGPEYKLKIYPESDGFTLRRVTRFKSNGHAVPCKAMRFRFYEEHHSTARFSLPRGCLKNPGKVRAAIRGSYNYASRIVVDWAPRYHRFFAWVPRG